ncbi:MAG: hypothetical protein F7C34_00710 [Desulfurococcales archaeon]|nr:hypothetical protein [Desulfurococcales archaeon]
MGKRYGLILITASVVLLIAASAVLYLYYADQSEKHVVYAKGGLNSFVAISISVPSGAKEPVIRVVASASDGGDGVRISVMKSNTTISTITVQPGRQADTSVLLEGPGNYLVVVEPLGLSSEGAIAVILNYKVPAIYTELSSYLAPIGIISGFLAGLGAAYVRGSGEKPSTLQRTVETSGEKDGEEGGGFHGQGS